MSKAEILSHPVRLTFLTTRTRRSSEAQRDLTWLEMCISLAKLGNWYSSSSLLELESSSEEELLSSELESEFESELDSEEELEEEELEELDSWELIPTIGKFLRARTNFSLTCSGVKESRRPKSFCLYSTGHLPKRRCSFISKVFSQEV